MSSLNVEQFSERECTPKCRSHLHAQNILNCVTKATPSEVRAYCFWLCHNFSTITDELGRNLLHLACSCGKWEIAEWLLDHCSCEPDVRDAESGWTALHRSLYYGYINAARVLLSHGASLRMTDHDGLTPLDIILKDRLPYIEYPSGSPSEVYVWGSNTNYNLGLGNEQNREYPEIVDLFRKDCISIKQVVMCKFHSVFLSSDGRLFSCGHGYGGRLGQVSESTSVAPALIHGVGSIPCEQVAAGQDHLVLLMQGGQVWTCGLNLYHQLGHSPPPERLVSPKPLSLKFLKGKEVIGVCAGRFHSVFYTRDSVFTFGLNAGQLGHPKGERTQILPHQVSALYNKEWTLTHVTASDGATVCATNRGDVFVLHEYQHRKIASRQRGIKKISVIGGNLDPRCDAAGVREGGGLELRVAILAESGKVFLWRQSDPFLRRCLFTPGRQLIISDIYLNHYTVGLVTTENEAFLGTILPFKPKRKPATDGTVSSAPPCKLQSSVSPLNVLLDRDECNLIRVKRIQFIHRANAITCDAKGRNFAVLQSSPKIGLLELPEITASEICRDFGRLLEEVNMHDNFHDVIIKVGEKYYPAHRFILGSRCEYFRKQFQCSTDCFLNKPTISVDGIEAAAFEQALKFIYTNCCDFFVENCEIKRNTLNFQETDEISTYIDVTKNGVSKVSKGRQSKKKSQKPKDSFENNPIKNMQEASKRLQMNAIAKQLEGVKLVNGKVKIEYSNQLPKLTFDRHKLLNLCDVTLISQDGSKFPCHRCILVSRSEYFHSMLGSCWMETSSLESLPLPISSDIISVILDFLYTDHAPGVFTSEDPEFLCHVLVVADQLLIVRLKEMCEMALVELLTLKNAPELLQLAFVYNAIQLKKACMEYICINLSAIIESKSLDVLSNEVMDELSSEYRKLVHSMCRRVITPYSGFPTKDEMKEIEKLFPVKEDCDIIKSRVEPISTKGYEVKAGKGKKRAFCLRQDAPLEVRQRCLSEPCGGKDIILSITADHPEIQQHAKSEEKESVHEPFPGDKHSPSPTLTQKPSETFMASPLRTEEFPELGKIISTEKKAARVMPKPISMHTDVKRTSHLSQKQKKMLALSSKEPATLMTPSVAASGSQMTKSTPSCPWGRQASQDQPSQSFWDVVPKGEHNSMLEVSSPESSLWSSPASPASPDFLKGSASVNAICGSPVDQPVVVSLEAIQRAEQEEMHSLVQPKIKSLQLINVEDQAIEELLVLYKAKDNPDERITVSRILPEKIARPVWKKKSFHA